MALTKSDARVRAWAMYRDLDRTCTADAEQEVQGIAVPVIQAVLDAAKEHLSDDPVVASIDALSADAISNGSLRAVDAALVVHQLAVALGPEHVMSVPSRVR